MMDGVIRCCCYGDESISFMMRSTSRKGKKENGVMWILCWREPQAIASLGDVGQQQQQQQQQHACVTERYNVVMEVIPDQCTP
ncbi:predicted protein [Lichtheimia corymbifera JMRC:FSU:9682]|uniref:Uncharacterized protein n=1 Tax=Lichtheimia corymbifera JMRC:FSU:9682 TaxID=1263082 RepID=A0A068SD96_9FUNG|nr:predicted protein [Lichtheimia corymbifera JMRC:FSU:9682]